MMEEQLVLLSSPATTTGIVYDTHIVRASGAAGAGEAHQLLLTDPATVVQFVDGALQTPPSTFGHIPLVRLPILG